MNWLSVCILSILAAFFGWVMSVQAGKHYRMDKAPFHIYMLLVFLTFSLGCGYIGSILELHRHLPVLELVWMIMTITAALLLIPIFYHHFLLLAGDRGGFCLGAGLVAMVLGLMFITISEYRVLPAVGMVSLLAFFIGYNRLRNLLHP
jgi:hypothetical protein